MKNLLLFIAVGLCSISLSWAQENLTFSPQKDKQVPFKFLRQDSSKLANLSGGLDSTLNPVEIPNALSNKLLMEIKEAKMPIKKLSGKNSAKMPGTELLDKLEQLEDSLKSRGFSDTLKRYKK